MWIVGNVRNGDLKREGAIYCGRPVGDIPGSILQNPFRSRDTGSREEAIRQHKQYLWKHIKLGSNLSPIARELYRLAQSADGILVCWCYPKACHCNTLVDAIEYLRESLCLSNT